MSEDFLQEFHDDITSLYDDYYISKYEGESTTGTPISLRISHADKVVERYFETYGERPKSAISSRLATYILLDTLTDPHPDKMAREEYPVMSYGQTGRYFARNTGLTAQPYASESVRGKAASNNPSGRTNKDDLLDAEDPKITEADDSILVHALLDGANLTERQRQAIDLVYFGDMTQEQAGEVMGVGKSTINEHISLSLQKLRGVFDKRPNN